MSAETATKNAAEGKKELERVIVLWIYSSKDGKKTYLSGKTEDGILKLIGFFNKEKQNPKEPDIRLYTVHTTARGKTERSEQVYTSLWVNATQNGKKVISGKLNDRRLVGFFNSKAKVGGTIPYINIYWSDDSAEAKKEEPKQAQFEEISSDSDL